jgi:tetratricopeptide (TPR) repeat protein
MVLATPRFLNLPLDRSHSLNAQRLVLSFEFLRPAFAAVKALYAAERLPESLWIIVQLERILVRFTHSATANAAASARRFAAEAAARGESDAAAQHISGSGNGPLLSEHVHRLLQALKYISGCIFLRLGDPERAYRSLRPAMMAHPRSFALAYVLNIVLRAQHYPNKAFKMLERLQRHRPDALPLRMILGHFYLVHQNWEQALSNYTRVWAALPRTPLLPLLIGVARLQQALKKTNQQRHHDLLLAFACLGHYRQLKEEQAQARASSSWDLFRPGHTNAAAAATAAAAAARQEACYNVARAFHTVGLGYLARPLYEQVLASSSEAGGGRTTTTGLGSLHAEAAHNLASIYEHAGSPELARKLYAQYCRI